MSRRNKYLIAALLILLIALIVALVVGRGDSVQRGGEEQGGTQSQSVPQSAVGVDTRERIDTTQLPPSQTQSIPDEALAAVSVARSFIERYETFSTESRYQNRVELFANMTPRLRAQEEAEVARLLSSPTQQIPFRSVTTRALVIRSTFADDQRARIGFSLQRIEQGEGVLPVTTIKDILVTLSKVGGVWLVDEMAWE